jgi:quinoprotein glucose dehydrogenase
LDAEATPSVGLNTPGVTYQDLLIIGGIGGPGAVRAFDVRTGLRRWIFHLIPRPGEFGYETWPAEAYKTATGLMPWSGQSLDEKRGIVYVPTKTAEPDFYGGNRHGANLFANSLVALDASTGKRLWHYQIVHHDLLDKDLPCPPVLLTVTHGGKKIDAVAQGTKHACCSFSIASRASPFGRLSRNRFRNRTFEASRPGRRNRFPPSRRR